VKNYTPFLDILIILQRCAWYLARRGAVTWRLAPACGPGASATHVAGACAAVTVAVLLGNRATVLAAGEAIVAALA
jgi:hypothetical protein